MLIERARRRHHPLHLSRARMWAAGIFDCVDPPGHRPKQGGVACVTVRRELTLAQTLDGLLNGLDSVLGQQIVVCNKDIQLPADLD